MKFLLILSALFAVSCAQREPLSIRQFHLTDTEVERDYYDRFDENPFVRGEINKRTHGAITTKEREARRGHYYNVNWSQLTGTKPVKILLEYRQGSSGAQIKTKTQTLPPASRGYTELQIIGSDYQQNGRVLSWRITLFEGKEKVASKQSYLWN